MDTAFDKLITTAATSNKMEGFDVDKNLILWCKKVLNKEITEKEYIEYLMKRAGIYQ